MAVAAAMPCGAKTLKLQGLTVRLGDPIEVTKQLGYGMEWPHSTYQPG